MAWAVVAVGVAAAGLALCGLAIWALIDWQADRRTSDSLAQRLYVDSRLEEMTSQTLAAMREAARRASGGRS